MRIVALLAWWNEHPRTLTKCITSLADTADHLIALDGAYALIPNATPTSPPEQAEAILTACHTTGITGQVTTPTTTYTGNEIQKRTHLFNLAAQATTQDDWLLVIDADEHITHTPPDLKQQLTATPYHAAMVSLIERSPHPDGPPNIITPHRMLFQALPGLTIGNAHHHYIAPHPHHPEQTIKLWGAQNNTLAPALDLLDLEVKHEHQPTLRRQQQGQYYVARDMAAIEQPHAA